MKIHINRHLQIWWILLFIGLFHAQLASAQTGSTILVQGKVLDVENIEIIGAVVKIQNRQIGTTTDEKGKFSINAHIGETLEISFMGYKKQIVKVTSSQPLTIVLEENSIELGNVVVVGYGTTSKEKLTGAVANVSTADFKNRPITDVSLALQGKVTGVQVTQNSGQPGSDGGTITIRGIGTLNNSSPLVIIDGFESSFDKVDPKDIESMTVLKDAASAAIYGNKAANGVILITTKKGKSGGMSIEYNGYLAVQDVTRYPSLLGSVDFLELYNEARINSGMQKLYSDEYINNFRRGDDLAAYPDRNWADFYFKPAAQQNHYLKLNGGTEKLTYTLSLGYLDQNGILQGTDYKKYSFRSNVNTSFLNDKLKIAANISGYVGDQTDLVDGTESTLARVVQMHPTVVAKMEGYGWTSWFYNDAVREAGGKKGLDKKSFTGNLNAILQITKQLKLEGAVSYDYNMEFGQTYAPNISLYTIETGSNGEQTIGKNSSRESMIRESTYRYGTTSSYATLSYWLNVNDDHHFKLLGGAQQSEWEGKYYQTQRSRLTANLPTLEVGDPATQKNSAWASTVRSLSLFGRFNYDYKDKYLFEANMRYDGSSKFAIDNKWGLFPSFSAGWRISEEPFLKKGLPWVNELKVRVSWGQLGNEKIWSSYAGIDILSVGTANYIWNKQSVTGSAVSYIANKDLTWETTTQKNVGLDFTILDSFSVSADFYIKQTDNILMQLPVSSTFGFTEDPWQNAGKMRNVGYEFTLGYNKELFKGFDFNANATLSFNKNKILDLKGMSPILNDTKGILLQEGLPINTLYGYEVEGIYQNEEEIHNQLKTFDRYGNPVNSYSGLVAAPGDIRFKDQNGDGIIDKDNDRVALGDPSPDCLFSFSTGARYKGFDFTIFLQGVLGGEGWSSGELVSPFFNNYNSAGWMINRWTPEKPNNTYQRVFIDSQRSAIKSAYYVEDMSYLRCKNIELGYTIPSSLLNKISITGARVFVSGQNMFTLTKYKGFDPERAGIDATNIYSYPLVKTFTAGINVTF
ncbi:MAG TPA: TonB-dependent receptor [Dysgonomonas sp.]|uniref:SusC/RagA family TonB-linked outer membrane protein n=1 Tax=unclassified Dysgonomonas TaxID=2630389 RepID=UPI0025B8B3F3|nr:MULTISPECIES: TonB-dependent receptor [unclassified Dysgonomonas]HML65321.1 TonB-dependent receptor [Dysgonomonas sp.]